MTIKHIRLSQQSKEHLSRLKTATGIDQWNVLCRWAFCLSLREPTPPRGAESPQVSNVEMSWSVFGGADADLYLAILKERCRQDGVDPTNDQELGRQFRMHLQRGIGYLFAARPKDIGALLQSATGESPQR